MTEQLTSRTTALIGLLACCWSMTLHAQESGVRRFYDERHGQGMTWMPTGTNATTPGAVTTPYPTIHNLAVEWEIDGDDNLNSVVAVRYRAAGAADWNQAMPLRRVPAMVYDSGAESNLCKTSAV